MMSSVFLFLYITFLHPLHLSVCDISLNRDTQSLEISHRLFADDLENVLRPTLGEKTDIINPADPEKLSKAIGDYVLQHFRLSMDNQQLNPRYLGYELDEDVVWVYFEVPNVHHLEQISVRNTLFFDIFEDQLNLINVKKDGKIQSMKLEPDQKEGKLRF